MKPSQELFSKSIKKLEQEIFTFKLNYGMLLNDGLEDKLDQVENLLEKQRYEME